MNTIAKLTIAVIATAALVSGITACAPGPAALPPTVTFCHSGFPAGAQYCGIKPTQIYFSGDAALSVRQITWSSWNASGAAGSGTWYLRTCLPNCVQGPVIKYPATLALSAVQRGRFTVLAVTLKGKKTIYHYPVFWPQSAQGCVQSPYCDQPAAQVRPPPDLFRTPDRDAGTALVPLLACPDPGHGRRRGSANVESWVRTSSQTTTSWPRSAR
jgi:hypothetical protein